MQISNVIYTSHPCQNGYHHKERKQILARMWRNGNSYILLMEMQLSIASMENTTDF